MTLVMYMHLQTVKRWLIPFNLRVILINAQPPCNIYKVDPTSEFNAIFFIKTNPLYNVVPLNTLKEGGRNLPGPNSSIGVSRDTVTDSTCTMIIFIKKLSKYFTTNTTSYMSISIAVSVFTRHALLSSLIYWLGGYAIHNPAA